MIEILYLIQKIGRMSLVNMKISNREPAAIKIPIKPKTSIYIEKPTNIVPTSLLYEPCSIIIKSIFPIIFGFAITVDKV